MHVFVPKPVPTFGRQALIEIRMAPALQRLPELTLTANATMGLDSFEAYRQAVSTIFDATLEDRAQSPDFRVHVDCIQLGGMLVSHAGMFKADYRYERSLRKVAQAGSDAVIIQIILGGSDLRLVKGRGAVSDDGDAH